jgi:hypothetical protein
VVEVVVEVGVKRVDGVEEEEEEREAIRKT